MKPAFLSRSTLSRIKLASSTQADSVISNNKSEKSNLFFLTIFTRLFVNSGLVNIDELIVYLNKILLNPNRIISPITDREGNRLWMVTTSDDVSKHLYHEGDIYVLKQPKNKKNFVGWFNTVDNKIYKPGDKYKVILGTHFIAKYK